MVVFNPQISQITRITLITLRAMRNLPGLIPRSLPRRGSFAAAPLEKQRDGSKNKSHNLIQSTGPNFAHDLFLGWVEHPDIFGWVSPAEQPAYQPFLFCYQRKPTK
jgi:hypothetical protein